MTSKKLSTVLIATGTAAIPNLFRAVASNCMPVFVCVCVRMSERVYSLTIDLYAEIIRSPIQYHVIKPLCQQFKIINFASLFSLAVPPFAKEKVCMDEKMPRQKRLCCSVNKLYASKMPGNVISINYFFL